MILVCAGLIPGAITQFYFFGWGILINLILCSSFAISAEALVLKIRSRSILATLKDNSALLTGLLLGLAIPPLLPWWMSFIGVYFAIIFAKHLYGGLGYNPFNPAMIGYVLLLISFPLAMTNWLPTQELLILKPNLIQSIELTFLGVTNELNNIALIRTMADGFTMATPLDHIRTSLSQGFMLSEILEPSEQNSSFSINSLSWIWVNVAYLVGGIYLLFLKIIRWHIPVSIIASMIIVSTILSIIDDQIYLSASDHLFYGASMIGVFFIATDPVSASTTQKGRLIFGALIGFTLIMIRTFGSYPDAFAFAVILLNIASPTIDHYFRPKVYGTKTTVKQIPEKQTPVKQIPIKQIQENKSDDDFKGLNNE
ncbi:MAG: electron transport complex subunit RsxD [Gammaproteobacteria bacterium]|nr:MAG: electron transport complex subunit RsxD [Gammaproteobacteria bacterium]